MNKKTSTKVLKVTSVVLAVEAVIVLILLIIILVGKWPTGQNVDNSAGSGEAQSEIYEESAYTLEESQTVQESSRMQSDSGVSVTVQDEDRDESAVQESDESFSNTGGDAESPAGTGDTASQESSVVEEESIIQSNWGEIDWN